MKFNSSSVDSNFLSCPMHGSLLKPQGHFQLSTKINIKSYCVENVVENCCSIEIILKLFAMVNDTAKIDP